MKKLILFLTLFCMMLISVSALVQYTGQPQLPYIMYGHVDWQSQALGGVRLELLNQNTGYSTITTTNEDGYWQEDGSSWQTVLAARPPIMFGDIIKIRTLDGCGTNDICSKSFSAFDSGFENFAVVDLSISGVLVVSPPSSGGSSGGGGGGGGVPTWTCQEWTNCDNGQQTRICSQGQFTRKEKQDCVVLAPVVTPPIQEPTIPVEQPEVPIELKCNDGTIVSNLNECLETSEQVKEYIWQNTGVQVGASVIGIGFIALVIYWVKRNRARAKKMVDTRIENLKKK